MKNIQVNLTTISKEPHNSSLIFRKSKYIFFCFESFHVQHLLDDIAFIIEMLLAVSIPFILLCSLAITINHNVKMPNAPSKKRRKLPAVEYWKLKSSNNNNYSSSNSQSNKPSPNVSSIVHFMNI